MTTAIRSYTDATGREQVSVTGPLGTFLVTRRDDFVAYEVWRSDSLDTVHRGFDLSIAVAAAERAAGWSAEESGPSPFVGSHRGAGLRYVGSVTDVQGWWVVSMDDCTCSTECYPDADQPWLATRATALLAPLSDPGDRGLWQRITCARMTSFVRF